MEVKPAHDNPVDGEKVLICGEKSNRVTFSASVIFSFETRTPSSGNNWPNQ
jgi:hypothetical protein